VAVAAPSATGLPPFTVATGDILFNGAGVGPGDDGDIYAIAPDGTNRRRLTNAPGIDWSARLAPGGATIAFSADATNHDRQLWLMNADGSNLHQLTGNDFSAYHPSWSPDGRRLVFGAFETQEIFVIDADGSNEARLSSQSDSQPEWSPDGKHIVFMRLVDGANQIFEMDADGSHAARLTTTGIEDALPSWSPDGTRIAFAEGKDATDIFVMHIDGSHVQRLTRDAKSTWPSWSPDGTTIAFTHNETSKLSDVWVMAADGSGAHAVTSDGSDWGPSWQ